VQGEHEIILASHARGSHHGSSMILIMTDACVRDIDELKAFLASSDAFTFKGKSREEIYAWIEHTLRS